MVVERGWREIRVLSHLGRVEVQGSVHVLNLRE
jgi:hypothetical protein